MEEAFVAKLLATGALTQLVGQRVHWSMLPQGVAYPAVALHRISGGRDVHLQGPSGQVDSRVQIDCWAKSYAAAKAVARAILPVVNGARFEEAAVTFGCVTVNAERDDYEGDGADKLYRTILDVSVQHSEPEGGA